MVTIKKYFARNLAACLLLVLLGIAAGGYYYYNYSCLDGPELVQRALRNERKLGSYFAALEMAVENNGAVPRYYVQVWFRAPGCYRVEVFTTYIGEQPPDQVFISDGENRWIYSPETGDFFLLNSLSARDLSSSSPFLLVAFLQDLARAPDVELLGVEKLEQGKYYLLKVIPPGATREYAWEKIWLERRSLLPVKIQSFDEQDRLSRTITFKKIDLNPTLNDELFSNTLPSFS